MTKTARTVWIAGNWKMNHGPQEASTFFIDFNARWDRASSAAKASAQNGKLRVAIFPPTISFESCVEHTLGSPVGVGAQNIHWEKKGAFTGEISGPMALEMGIKLALVGHSERRQYFGETDETARKRTESLLAQGISVILCIGETRVEREAGRTQEILERQLSGVFTADGTAARFLGVQDPKTAQLIIAYEPVWAIGTGLTATPAQAQEAHAQIREFLKTRIGDAPAQATPLLYGGSVTPENAAELLGCPDVDGALVGGASLKPDSFLKLIDAGSARVANLQKH